MGMNICIIHIYIYIYDIYRVCTLVYRGVGVGRCYGKTYRQMAETRSLVQPSIKV